MHIDDFAMPPGERKILHVLAGRAKAGRIAEFGCGGSTAVLARATTGVVMSWDNMPEWIETVQRSMAGEPWKDRVHIQAYQVTPEGNRDVEKDPVPYDGPDFDMVFIDGPRSAHQPSYGRHGSFRFAVRHTRSGGIIAWHDNDRPHEREMARRYLGAFTIHEWGRIGWCWKTLPTLAGKLMAPVSSLMVRRILFLRWNKGWK